MSAASHLDIGRRRLLPTLAEALRIARLPLSTPADLLAKARSVGEKTEAHTYIAFRAEMEGRKDEAITHFQWVSDHGVPTSLEHGMARAALKRLQR